MRSVEKKREMVRNDKAGSVANLVIGSGMRKRMKERAIRRVAR